MTASLQEKLEHLYGLRLYAARYSNHDQARTPDRTPEPARAHTPTQTSESFDNFRHDYKELLNRLGNPHLRLPPVIHVAGTNGKGSTVSFLRAMFEADGKRVHTYTSPHLVKFNERLRVAGTLISDKILENLLDEVLAHTAALEVTFFEVVTAMAFTIFTRVPADICIIEVGMGGRMDCTNIIPAPRATIITRISFDHTQYLGDSLATIAGEKAGIIKPGVPCIIGYQQDAHAAPSSENNSNSTDNSDNAALETCTARAQQLDAPLHRAGHEWDVRPDPARPGFFTFRYGPLLNAYPLPALVGAHQLQNAGAALACVMALANRDSDPEQALDSLSIHPDSIAKGLTSAQWPGRLQRLEQHLLCDVLPPDAELWLDGGHNDSAGAVLAAQARAWHEADAAPLHLVIAMKGDKAAAQFLKPLLPHAQSVTFIPLPGMAQQSHDPAQLSQTAHALHPALAKQTPIKTAPDLSTALTQIADNLTHTPAHNPAATTPRARILITGSLYLAGAVLEKMASP